MLNKFKPALFFVLALSLFLTSLAGAAVPGEINYQGKLTDDTGAPLDGVYLMNFYLYDLETGGTDLWNEQQSVTLTDGIFNVRLGSQTSFVGDEFDNADLFLEIEIFKTGSGWETLTPRQKFTSTAFALRADDSDTLEGHTSSYFSSATHDHDTDYVNEGQANAIGTSMIQDGSISAADLAPNSVGASEISSSAVGTSELATDAVTLLKMANNSVGSNEILNASIRSYDLYDGTALAEILDDDGSGSGLDADLLDGHNTSYFMTAASDYWVNTTGDTMTGNLTVNSNILAANHGSDYVGTFTNSGTGNAYAIKGVANSTSGRAYGLNAYVDAGGSAAFGIYIDADHTGAAGTCYGSIIYSTSTNGSAYGLRANTDVSSESTSNAYGIFNTARHDGTSGTAYGIKSTVYGSDTGDAYGVYSTAQKYSSDTAGNAYGGYFIADNDHSGGESYGLYTTATGTNGSRYGLYSLVDTSGSSGYSNYGVYSNAETANGPVHGFYGDVDSSSSSSAYGMCLDVYKSAAATGTLYGNYVIAMHGGTSGTSYGTRSRAYSSDSGSAYGGYFLASYGSSSDTGNLYGVRGYAYNSSESTSYAGYFAGGDYAGHFVGNVRVTGNLSKAGGSFRIDHPLDPENKYLQHSFVESPDMMNVYNGNVVLDQNGEALVELPDWFETLNRDFRYQLTCIGGFAQVYIAEEVLDNVFKIAGGISELKVSWQITGVRKDPWANANRIKVEEDKPDKERGYYLHPEAYGKSAKNSIEWANDPEMMQAQLDEEAKKR